MAAMYVGTSPPVPPKNIGNDDDLHKNNLNSDVDNYHSEEFEEQNSMTSSNSSTTLSQKYLVSTTASNSNTNSIIIMNRSDDNSHCRNSGDRKRNSVIQKQPEEVFDPPDGGFQVSNNFYVKNFDEKS